MTKNELSAKKRLKAVNFRWLLCCTAIKMPKTIKKSAIGEKMQTVLGPHFSLLLTNIDNNCKTTDIQARIESSKTNQHYTYC